MLKTGLRKDQGGRHICAGISVGSGQEAGISVGSGQENVRRSLSRQDPISHDESPLLV